MCENVLPQNSRGTKNCKESNSLVSLHLHAFDAQNEIVYLNLEDIGL